ncbi:hypothetical protein RJ44_06935 [Alteromonas macleodii]|uniref:ATP-dependent nuclease n=1 Tax=Alteromonas macleodii TaxID=28108 RepID=UPI0005801A66|nr:AAA family ATPase [Alteromonas macleodii]KHT59966.1 hypothetical protein RJ44_06935 [Alteromonas macleodii]
MKKKPVRDSRITRLKYAYIRGLSNHFGYESNKPKLGGYINFEDINIFIGENGSGKSTIIDMIRSTVDPSIIPSLPREVMEGYIPPHFDIHFKRGDSYSYLFKPYSKNDPKHSFCPSKGSNIVARHLNADENPEIEIVYKKFNFEDNEKELSKLKVEDLDLIYISSDNHVEVSKAIVDELNILAKDLPSLYSDGELVKPTFKFIKEKIISVALQSDERMNNFFHTDCIASGWLQFANIMMQVRAAKKRSIVLIEEPEVNLHPRLARRLFSEIQSEVKNKNIQVFIATHSAIFMNAPKNPNIRVFSTEFSQELKRDVILEKQPCKEILDNLGYKMSDFLQSNGVIWVEGPSDRIYLLDWLKAYASFYLDKNFKFESLSFEFAFYGGSTLTHFGIGDELIDMLKINQNLAVIIDNDNEFHRPNDSFLCTNKEKVYRAYNKSRNSSAWVTHGYTIESYLPDGFRSTFFRYNEDGRLIKTSGYSKPQIAGKYVKLKASEKLLKDNPELLVLIRELFERIVSWN